MSGGKEILFYFFSHIPTSLIDCRRDVCSVYFLSGCNMKCIYCQNYPQWMKYKPMYLKEFEEQVSSNWSIGIVKFSGGEPTLQANGIIKASEVISSYGLGLAIDTNGFLPKRVEKIVCRGVVEASVDLKSTKEKYSAVTGVDGYDRVIETIRVFKEYGVDFEVRTTVFKPVLEPNDLRVMARELHRLEVPLWFIQTLKPTSNTPSWIKSYESSEIKALIDEFESEYGLVVKLR